MSEELAKRFPSNDVLLVEVMAAIQERRDDRPFQRTDLYDTVANRIGFEAMLQSEENARILRGAVGYCLEILEREGLVERSPNWELVRATPAGLEADHQALTDVWARELARSDAVFTDKERAVGRILLGFLDM